MLLIGNAMNQGSRKEEVSGFTLDSLLKIISMKGITSLLLLLLLLLVIHSIESPHRFDACVCFMQESIRRQVSSTTS
jgi:hypothetical protein